MYSNTDKKFALDLLIILSKAHHPVPAMCGPRQMLVPPGKKPGQREA